MDGVEERKSSEMEITFIGLQVDEYLQLGHLPSLSEQASPGHCCWHEARGQC